MRPAVLFNGRGERRAVEGETATEYVILRAVQPRWLSLQFPEEVASILRYHPENSPELRYPSRTIAFLARGPGIVRVVAAHPARELVAVETVRNRRVASARLGERMVFNLPYIVTRHLGVQLASRGPRAGRGTDDALLWFLPAPEYYEYRAAVESKRPWTGPSTSRFAHVYLVKSLVPFSESFDLLDGLERRIEDEGRPLLEAIERGGARTRRLPPAG